MPLNVILLMFHYYYFYCDGLVSYSFIESMIFYHYNQYIPITYFHFVYVLIEVVQFGRLTKRPRYWTIIYGNRHLDSIPKLFDHTKRVFDP